MVHDTITVLVYGNDLAGCTTTASGEAFTIIDQYTFSSGNYLALDLKCNKAGTGYIHFSQKGLIPPKKIAFDIKRRIPYNRPAIGPSDVIYLLMPDRFADGNPNNNIIPGNQDNVQPDHKWGRKGGDLNGIIQHFNYLKDLDISTLWLTPIYENNYQYAYHGYTPSDLYAIDPHLGTAADYKDLIRLLHENQMKIIQDHIVNHISPDHPLAKTPPAADWLNGNGPTHHSCDYKIESVTDYHGMKSPREYTQAGWFAGYLTDMNMANPDVVKYYTQQTIWWIEEFQLDGIREDTYPYSDQTGLRNWAAEIRREYGDIFLVGETMTDDPVTLSYFFSSASGYQNGLSSVTDFPLAKSIKDLLAKRLPIQAFYRQIGQDFIYQSPNDLLVFLDNHDMGRYASEVDPSSADYINAFTLLYGLRGIPMIYYGNEFGLPGGHDPDNRRLMPGGFTDTDGNIFKSATRNSDQTQLIQQFREFNKLRKNHPALFTGQMYHAITDDGSYIAIRHSGNEYLFTIYNPSTNEQSIDLKPYLPASVRWSAQIAPQSPRCKFLKKNAVISVPPGYATMWFIEIEEINR